MIKNKIEPIRLLFFGYPSNLVNYKGVRYGRKSCRQCRENRALLRLENL